MRTAYLNQDNKENHNWSCFKYLLKVHHIVIIQLNLVINTLNSTSDSNNNWCLLDDFNTLSGTLSDFTDLNRKSCGSLLGHDSQLILSRSNLQEKVIIQMTN